MSDDAVERKMSILLREKRKDAMRRGDIFGESVQFDTPLELKSVAKSAESTGIIRQALLNNFLFYTIGHSDIDSIVDFMAEKTACAGEVVIKEGDTGDFFYIVETGLFSISVHGNVVNTVQRGATFGELALVYNCPRTASVTCSQSGRLWTLDRVTFRRLVARIQSEQIGECKNALRKVSLLHALTETQLSQLAEASQFVKFAKGDRIIKKGERGNVLYIIKSGAVICTDVGDSHRMESVRLTENDYFGERALMTHEPRAANVTAETDVTLIALDRQAFDDQLGSLREVIDHNMSMRVLQSIPMLKVLSPSEKEKLFLALEPVSFADGEYVIKEGDHGTAFYIIKSGSAVVSKSITSNDENGESATEKRQVATLSTGNFFGEMSLLHGEPRQADVIANGNLECLSLDQGKFVELLGPIQEILNREAEERMAALKMQEQRQIKLDDLEVLRTLGAGTFGRVKLMVVGHSPFAGSNQVDQMQICRNIVKEKVEFPGWVSSSCRDIILKLLERDLTKRLGLTHGGARAIRSHAWFTKLDWDAMRLKKVNAPYRPKLADPLDASKFEAINDHDEEVPAYKPEGYEWDKDF
ncbi:hypothetical protein PRIC2_002276 [Phytophthora ramorum]